MGRVDRRAIVFNVVVTLAVAVALNAALAAFGLNPSAREHWPRFAPPAHTIGAVWVALLAGMGAARGLAQSAATRHARDDARADDARAIVVLILLCLAYPFYTHLVGGRAIELAGNGVTLLYAVWLTRRLLPRSATAALLVGAVAVWIVFATALVFGLVQLNGWAT
jgi:tryptophan-rich sensory protein